MTSATRRNSEPIWQELSAVLSLETTGPLTVLEIASGSGQHAAYFTTQLNRLIWQPSDPDEATAKAFAHGPRSPGCPAGRLLPPLNIDTTAHWECTALSPFSSGQKYDAIFCANMIHIAPWEAAQGLITHCPAVLAEQVIYSYTDPFCG